MYFSNKFSRLFGILANYKFPKSVQIFINKFYVRLFKIDLSEFDNVETYDSLNALFTRSLRIPRKIDSKDYNLVSPTDSLIIESGRVEDNKALQIKGKSYDVATLLGLNLKNAQNVTNINNVDSNNVTNLNDYSYINLYLSPKDYHHYHAPCDVEILESRYFSGRLLPVNFPSLRKNDSLYSVNERVVLKMRLTHNNSIAFYVAVGALNVGKMRFLFDEKIQSNASLGDFVRTYETPFKLKAGQEIGTFEMGSTIVLIAKANFTKLANDVVKMGEEIGTLS